MEGTTGYPADLGEWKFPAPFDKGIDAALEGRFAYEKRAYFFKDDKYIAYDWVADKVAAGPKSILDEWGLPAGFFGGKKKVDGAVNGAGDYSGIATLFSGAKWIQVDWKDEEPAKGGAIDKDWGLPPDISKGMDAALSGWGKDYGNKAYFFADKKYSRYDWDKGAISRARGSRGVEHQLGRLVRRRSIDRRLQDPRKGPVPSRRIASGRTGRRTLRARRRPAEGEDGIFFHGLEARRLLRMRTGSSSTPASRIYILDQGGATRSAPPSTIAGCRTPASGATAPGEGR